MKNLIVVITFVFLISVLGYGEPAKDNSNDHSSCYNYPLGFFTKTRTAKTLKQGKTSLILKYQYYDWDQKRNSSGDYEDIADGQSRSQTKMTLGLKYGLTDDWQIGTCIPYIMNNFNLGSKSNDDCGAGNIAIFQKYRLLEETEKQPGVAVDFWYYLPSGDSNRNLGSSDGSYKITTEVSKSWKDFSLHFNPGYKWSETKGSDSYEINSAIVINLFGKIKPVVEHNYLNSQSKGEVHDIVPGIMWKLNKTATLKTGLVCNLYSSQKWKDECGLVVKLCCSF